MLKVGDKIVYGANGVMTIIDIREESFGGACRSYYVLAPMHSKSESQVFVPTDSERLVSMMRPLVTKEEIFEMFSGSAILPEVRWIEANRARQEHFKKILESGDRREILAVIRAIDESAKQREMQGKKNFLADENIKLRATNILYSEISVVLGIPEDEVGEFIQNLTM